MPVDDSYTVCLLHMNGADASTTFTDESGKTWTAAGNAQIDTAQSKFGGASGLFDGTGDWITTPDSADFDIGAGDWTIDFWIQFSSTANSPHIFTHYTDANNWWRLYREAGNWILQTDNASTVTVNMSRASTVNTGTWYHIACVHSGTTYYIFQDGSLVGTSLTDTDNFINASSTFRIGCFTTAADTNNFNGWIDEFRISKGIARWTGNFTPPSSEYAPPFNSRVIFL